MAFSCCCSNSDQI